MPLCRYMDSGEFDAIYNSMDKELLELCEEIFLLTGTRYAVESREIRTQKRRLLFFKRKESRTSCVVLVMLNAAEAQCINLLSGLGGGYSRQEAGAFLVGVLAQAWEQRKAEACHADA